MKLAAIINPLSRTVPKGASDELKAAIAAAGHELVSLSIASDDLEARAHAAAESGADAIVVWGGDGTLACVLTICGADGPPVLTLPGGTMNMLPRRLHGEGSWHEVLDRVLADPEERVIAAGDVDGHRFYVAALFGRLTGLAESREAVRKGQLLDAAQTMVDGDVLSVETRLSLHCGQAGNPDKARGPAIEAVAAAVALTDGPHPAFDVASIDPSSALELISTAMDAMIRGWRDADAVERDVTSSVTVEDPDGLAIPSTLDGEQVQFETPVEVRLIERAAKVLCARASH
jgi:diacylglycerol kinase family enzyme